MNPTQAVHAGTESDRDYQRTDVNLLVIRRSRDEIYNEFARVLGAGGMFVKSADPPDVGETLSMEFVLPGIEPAVEIRAEVVWRRGPGTTDAPGMGIRFLDVEDKLREQIGGFVERASEPESS
jgi:uncharacterized protein (TIGR02266 family)